MPTRSTGSNAARSRAIFARSSGRDPYGSARSPTRGEDDVDRRAQEDDLVEAVVQGGLVRHAARNEEPACAVTVQERADPLEVPQRFDPMRRLDADDPSGS